MKLRCLLTLALPLALWCLSSHQGAQANDLKTDGPWLKDEHGRTVMLRGVSLGGSSKLPTVLGKDLFDHRHVSFVGRPFPLEQADAHFTRLKAWGLDFVRWVVPWEAVEHAGTGLYDREYLAYLHDAVAKANKHGIRVLIDSHQDAWSRWTGGDGAPGWTLEAVGIELRQLQATGAATATATSMPHPDDDPMRWTTNYIRHGAATMFTLFFGGNDFAPGVKVNGVPVQEYLQSHYINAMKQVALAVAGLPNVVGFGTLNEPGRGYIGLADLKAVPQGLTVFGLSPTPLQNMFASAGLPQQVEVHSLQRDPPGRAMLNPHGASLWRLGVPELWRREGVWGDGELEPSLLQPDHFSKRNGKQVDFVADHLMPFIKRYASGIRSIMPDALIFIEPTAVLDNETLQPRLEAGEMKGVVAAPKWFDGPTLATRAFYPWLDAAGREGRKRQFVEEVAQTREHAAQRLPGMPVLIGEFGLPMSLDGKRAYATGDYRLHIEAMDGYFGAIEQTLSHALLWNYTPDNTHRNGDGWNGEDFSIFSADDPVSESASRRAVAAVARPYPVSTAGEPVSMRFDLRQRQFEYRFRPDPAVKAPTEVFVPPLHYPKGYQVSVSGGRAERDCARQRVKVWADAGVDSVLLRLGPRAEQVRSPKEGGDCDRR